VFIGSTCSLYRYTEKFAEKLYDKDMLRKVWLILFLAASLIAGLVFWYTSLEKPVVTPVSETLTMESPLSSDSTFRNLVQPSPASSSTLEARVKSLEKEVADLKTAIKISPVATTSVSPAPQSLKYPLYIPLGLSGQTGDRNYVDIEAFEANLNPGDYNGYSSMQLLVNLKLAEQAGTARARLFNKTDKQPVPGSDVSTSNNDYTLLTSVGFKLPGGPKTYTLQVQSTEGITVDLQNARIKVNF
jgi:hypothetical protein